MMRTSRMALAGAAAALLSACAGSGIVVGGPGVGVGVGVGPRSPYATARGDTVIDRVFFGRGMPGGAEVSDSAFAGFLREVVTPRFPAGLTFYHADGQWRGREGATQRERAFVLEIIHPAGPAGDADLREIAAEYKRRFAQEAVLRATSPVQVRIYE